MGFAESIYTTVAISFDGYSTDLLKGKCPTRVKSECNACKHMLLAMYMYLPIRRVHTRAHLRVAVECSSTRA